MKKDRIRFPVPVPVPVPLHLLLTLVHTLVTVIALPAIYFLPPKHPVESLILAFSFFYYFVDSIFILILISQHFTQPCQSESNFHQSWYLVHHICCIWCLSIPLFLGLDSRLILIGLWLGEISNPPRIAGEILHHFIQQYEQTDSQTQIQSNLHLTLPFNLMLIATGFSNSSIEPRRLLSILHQYHSTLSQIHLALFVIFRYVCSHYYVEIVWKQAESIQTVISSGLILLLSLLALIYYLFGVEGVKVSTKASNISIGPSSSIEPSSLTSTPHSHAN